MKNFENKQPLNFNPVSNRQTMGHDFITGSSSQSVVEEKVAHLSLQLNQIIIKPYLQQALDYLKSSKFDAINAYNKLSDQIGNEVRIISQNIDELTNKINNCQDTINRTQEIIRNKYANASEEEISSGALNLEYEYNIVAEHYELSLQLTQEISKYKSRIENLLSTQGLLDESSVPAVNRIQLEVDNLELLLHNLDSTDYAEALAKKQGRRNTVSKKDLKKPALTGRQEALADYAQQLSANSMVNINQLQKGPNVGSMVSYEDPNGLTINRKKYPFENGLETTSPEMMNGNAEQAAHLNNLNNEILLNREEMRMQKKLYRQQLKLQKMQIRNNYQAKINEAANEAASMGGEGAQKVSLKPVFNKLFKKNLPIEGRFSNAEEEEAVIARAKSELDNYSEYLSNEMDNQRAFGNEINSGRSIKVIR